MSYQKYTTALAMMDTVIAAHEDGNKNVHPKWDELYEFVFANFPEPNSANNFKTKLDNNDPEVQSMVEMFKLNREDMEAHLYRIPPTILEQCFPVWMARYMLCCNHRSIHINPGKLSTFGHFHKLYGPMIVFGASIR